MPLVKIFIIFTGLIENEIQTGDVNGGKNSNC